VHSFRGGGAVYRSGPRGGGKVAKRGNGARGRERYDAEMRVTALVLAAGRGQRLGAALPKALVSVGARPLWVHAADALAAASRVEWILPVAPPGWLDRFDPAELGDVARRKWHTAVAGGAERQDSVRAGLAALPAACDGVAVHDAARPGVAPGDVDRVIAAAEAHGAALLALPSADTIKRVRAQIVVETPPRSECWAAQTPQVFRRDWLQQGLDRAAADSFLGTDDAQLVERLGHPVHVVEGSARNLKVTHPGDVGVVETGLGGGRLTTPRIGQSFDAHQLVADRPLWLGGIEIPYDRGLEGHSDGDVLLHVVAGALLGALGEGDLGAHFPSADSSLRGIASGELVARVLERVRAAGCCVGNIDTTVIAQVPRLGPFRAAMAERLAKLLDVPIGRANVKVTSTDHLGAVGRGEGIAASAVVLLLGAEPA